MAGLRDGTARLFGHDGDLFDFAGAHDDHEIIPAESRHRGDRPGHGLEPLGDFLKELVALGVPEAVIDPLEVVQVHQQHRESRIALFDGVINAIQQQLPVRQARERIEMRQEFQLARAAAHTAAQGVNPDHQQEARDSKRGRENHEGRLVTCQVHGLSHPLCAQACPLGGRDA